MKVLEEFVCEASRKATVHEIPTHPSECFCNTKRLDDDRFDKMLLTTTQTCPWTKESMFEKSDEVTMQEGLLLEPQSGWQWGRGLGTLGLPLLALMTEAAANHAGRRTHSD